MEKVSIVYWSQTGNTEAMANMLAKGVEEAGASAEVIEVSDASASDLLSQAGFAWVPRNLRTQFLSRS